MFSFTVTKKLGEARLTEYTTPHGTIHGPFFQFVATQAAIRGMAFSEDLEKMGVQIVLANTYHLHIRPGEDVIDEAGKLHGFMNWDKPITTDSGGYQVFSLAKRRKLSEDGVTFRSPLDGAEHTLTPEGVIQIQAKLGPDITMPLDVCTPFTATREEIEAAVAQTTRWAKRCKEEHLRIQAAGPVTADSPMPSVSSGFYSQHRLRVDTPEFLQAGAPPAMPPADASQVLYGIVQGGVYPDLRERSANELKEIGFFGYSIGGELREGNEKALREVVWNTTKHLPEGSPRYLMGYGLPEDIVEAVRAGVDHFDCVLPVRNARHGQVMFDLNREELVKLLKDPERPVVREQLYTTIDITKSPFARDFSVFSPGHPVIEKPYTKAYVHHLMRAEVPSGMRLTVLHDIYFYVQLMQAIRETISGE